jgi:hypothetical protein
VLQQTLTAELLKHARATIDERNTLATLRRAAAAFFTQKEAESASTAAPTSASALPAASTPASGPAGKRRGHHEGNARPQTTGWARTQDHAAVGHRAGEAGVADSLVREYAA